jgi:hypothetical protein
VSNSGKYSAGEDRIARADTQRFNAPILPNHGIQGDFTLNAICFGRVRRLGVSDSIVVLVLFDGNRRWLVIACDTNPRWRSSWLHRLRLAPPFTVFNPKRDPGVFNQTAAKAFAAVTKAGSARL